MEPLLSNKYRLPVNVTLVKEIDLISDNDKIAYVFNDFYINVAKRLNIIASGDILREANKIKYLVLRTIEKDSSIKAIAGISNNFILEKVSYEEIQHEIKQLDTRKGYKNGPFKIFKMNSDISADFFIKILAMPLQHQCIRRISKMQV